MPTIQNLKQNSLPWKVQIPYRELAEYERFSEYIFYLISQFTYLNHVETVKFYEMSFKEEREAQRALALFGVFKNDIKMDNTVTRKLTKEEFLVFHEWCYNNIRSGWIIYGLSGISDQFEWSMEIPIFVESMEEMVMLKLKWC